MKYKSTLFDEARNKIGSIVASKNRNGNYFRDRVTPHNPRTAQQAMVRGRFTALSQAWRGITPTQRAGWIALANQITLRDTLGNSYHPSGQQLYVSCGANLTTIGQAPIDTPLSSPPTLPDISDLVVVATVLTAAPHTQTLSVEVTGGTTPDILVVNATAQFSAGRNFVGRSQYRFLADVALPTVAPVDLITAYNPLFGNLVVGSKLSISVKAIDDNGFASADLRADVIVSAV